MHFFGCPQRQAVVTRHKFAPNHHMRISHTLLILSMIALDLTENQIVINALIIFQKLKKKTGNSRRRPRLSKDQERKLGGKINLTPDFPKCLAPKTVKHFGRQRNPKKRERIALLF